MKQNLFNNIENNKNKLFEMANYIFDNPELGYKEYKASKLLTDFLENEGFVVEKGLGSLDTAFRAIYEVGSDGPVIGLFCEYDALDGLGHACAHHMQGPSIVGAAKSIKDNIKDYSYKLVVYGTPAEESYSGKLRMISEGYLTDVDVALMMHGGPATQTDVKSLAATNIKVIFTGKSSHAALKPESGRSALDALLLAFQGIEFLREHVLEDTRMHYTVLDAGGPANIVPKNAVGSFSLRSYNSDYLKEVVKRFEKVILGASIMTETEYKLECEKTLESKVPSYKLNQLLMNNAQIIDAPNIQSSREKTGSTDFGNVTYLIPGACIRVAFVEPNTSSHSKEFLDAGKSKEGHNAILNAAKILSGTIYDMISDNRLVKDIQDEFLNIKRKMALVK